MTNDSRQLLRAAPSFREARQGYLIETTMDVITLEAQPREAGRKTARATRRAGNVPCILYGNRVEPVAFEVSEKSLKPLIFTHETHLITVKLDSNAWYALPTLAMRPALKARIEKLLVQNPDGWRALTSKIASKAEASTHAGIALKIAENESLKREVSSTLRHCAGASTMAAAQIDHWALDHNDAYVSQEVLSGVNHKPEGKRFGPN